MMVDYKELVLKLFFVAITFFVAPRGKKEGDDNYAILAFFVTAKRKQKAIAALLQQNKNR
ncbi:unnamed protein product, partial [Sphagnum balticum]